MMGFDASQHKAFKTNTEATLENKEPFSTFHSGAKAFRGVFSCHYMKDIFRWMELPVNSQFNFCHMSDLATRGEVPPEAILKGTLPSPVYKTTAFPSNYCNSKGRNTMARALTGLEPG